ncbi:carbon storage regulator CsrA [Fictibacillus phosphorivorans]|uniref:carbon storage regulator CsrA n=1 Tax=Fictibacillus phosphorivorans TaxID=1221500 RepID=UPI00203BCC5F|nr:carbon storage regulator CsrA [Fictibacillus phosphorivorans]MCM3718463.1 carbon storage regulator CsrA [Fictibacillus phosphorivorans]MCM3776181.1 carbon storage regulator CsrA [Fictibacillus phosphorivorans]
MLVLTRKLQEAIKIGDDIELTVLSIDGEQVKLGISAPKNIEIHRKEVFLSIQQENNEAAETSLKIFQQLKKLKKNNM